MKYTYFFIVILSVLLSCTTENTSSEEHEDHEVENVVFLNKKQQEALDLKLGTFQMRNITSVVKINGELKVPPENKADVTAIIGGNVKFIKVFVGDKVSKGQILAVLEHPDYITLQEDFAVVASSLEFLEQEYERQKELYENNVGSGKDYQKAKADYNTAKAKYEGLKSRLILLKLSPDKVKNGQISSTIYVLSPISGYVNKVNIKLGTYVDAKDVMFEIADNSAIHADFMVYEEDVHLLKEGQTVHFTVSNQADKEYTATVFAIGKEFDEDTRAIHIHARIEGEITGLVSGMYITGHLHTDESYTQTLPVDAIVKEGTKSYVFIVDENFEDKHADEEHEDEHKTAFRMVEILTGSSDESYIEADFAEDFPENTQIVLNSAYYLLADMKKEETEHEH